MPIVVLMSVLSSLEQRSERRVSTRYSTCTAPRSTKTGDVIDTFVYPALAIEQAQFAPAAAVGLFKSIVSFLLVSLSYLLADRVANYRIF